MTYFDLTLTLFLEYLPFITEVIIMGIVLVHSIVIEFGKWTSDDNWLRAMSIILPVLFLVHFGSRVYNKKVKKLRFLINIIVILVFLSGVYLNSEIQKQLLVGISICIYILGLALSRIECMKSGSTQVAPPAPPGAGTAEPPPETGAAVAPAARFGKTRTFGKKKI